MRAITLDPSTPDSADLEEMPEPGPQEGSILVDGVALGICGTDAEIVRGDYGEAPPGADRLILGHESLGRVLDAPDDSGLAAGHVLAGIVRRPVHRDPQEAPAAPGGRHEQPAVDPPRDRARGRVGVVVGREEAQQHERPAEEHDLSRRRPVHHTQEAERDLLEIGPVRAGEPLQVLGRPDPVELLAREADLRLLPARDAAVGLVLRLRLLDDAHPRQAVGPHRKQSPWIPLSHAVRR